MASYYFIEGLIVRKGYLGESGGGIMSLFTDDFLNPAKNGQWNDVKSKSLNYSRKSRWVLLYPSKSEIMEFLMAIHGQLDTDNSYYLYDSMPSLKGHRVDAIKELYAWVSSVPKCFFPLSDINPFRVALQLALRVLWPDSALLHQCLIAGVVGKVIFRNWGMAMKRTYGVSIRKALGFDVGWTNTLPTQNALSGWNHACVLPAAGLYCTAGCIGA